MPRRGLGERVILKRVGVERTSARQSPESARELRAPALEVVRTQLIDGEKHDERWSSRGIRQRTRRALSGTTLRGERHRTQQSDAGDMQSNETVHLPKLARGISHVTSM